MIRVESTPCFTVVCDDCGESLPGSDEVGIMHMSSEVEAQKTARDYDWQVAEDGKVQCMTCHEESR